MQLVRELTWTLKGSQEALLSLFLSSHSKIPGTLSLACWGLSAFLINTVTVSRSRIWGQRWSLFQTSKSFLILMEGKIYLFLRKRHKIQHSIIPLCLTLIYFTRRFAFKNRKQIILPEWLQSLAIIPICNHVASMEHLWGSGAVGAWEWGGEREEGERSKEMMRRGELPEAQQFEIIAWMNYLLYFLNWTKACLSWEENQEN